MTNQLGDVFGITDVNGNQLVTYTYDEWGSVKRVICGRDEEKLANSNPIRYRGYYYDTETGYYYLQSRYYDPSICRFINSDNPEIAKISKGIIAGANSFAYCNNDPVNYVDVFGYARRKINLDKAFGKVSIISSVLSAIGTISLLAFKKTPWGKLISLAITIASVGVNFYSYAKAIDSAKKHYGKKSKNYKQLLRYNNVILAANMAFIIVSEIFSKGIVKKYSATIALALIGCRTITIVGMSINIAELLSGKSVVYKNRLKR